MKSSIFILGTAMLAACASTATVSSSGGDVLPAIPTNARTIPIGTTFQATFDQAIGTSVNHVGDHFTATVSNPVIAANGQTVVPAGAAIYGHITGLHSNAIPGEQSVIRLDFDEIAFNSRRYPFDAEISNVDVKRTVDKNGATKGAVTGGAAGAVLGAILSGGELSKILSGGLLGAAAGTVISLGTGDLASTIPAGSPMTLRATTEVIVR